MPDTVLVSFCCAYRSAIQCKFELAEKLPIVTRKIRAAAFISRARQFFDLLFKPH
jgi:hypothetical protein